MRRNHLLVRSAVLLLLVSKAIGQNPPTVTQEAKNSPCSNVVALVGNVSLDCSSLTPKQQELIEGIPPLLRKILAEQLDPKLVMDKLDEIKKGVDELRNANPTLSPKVRLVPEYLNKPTKFDKYLGRLPAVDAFLTSYRVVVETKIPIPVIRILLTGDALVELLLCDKRVPGQPGYSNSSGIISGHASCTIADAFGETATVGIVTTAPDDKLVISYDCSPTHCAP